MDLFIICFIFHDKTLLFRNALLSNRDQRRSLIVLHKEIFDNPKIYLSFLF